jgi:threonine/homoserine/homoserine lactone efflux protein
MSVLAAKQWRDRPRLGDQTQVPGWMRAIDEFTIAKSAGAGFALSGLNPKNVLLTAAAALEIAEHGLRAGEQAAVLVGFVLIASIGVQTPLVLTLALSDRSHGLLEGTKPWRLAMSGTPRPCLQEAAALRGFWRVLSASVSTCRL